MKSKLFAISVAMISAATLSLGGSEKSTSEVFYFPFEYDTLRPINEARMREQYNITSLMLGTGKELRNKLEKGAHGCEIDRSKLRLLIGHDKGAEVLVDQQGCVWMPDKPSMQLSKSQLHSLRKFIFERLPNPPEPKIPERG